MCERKWKHQNATPPCYFAMSSALVCIWFKILLLLNRVAVYIVLIMTDLPITVAAQSKA
jgi:hypothetical protein